ncbi:hypothetical protein BGX28_009198 [Mortierella sp. GBA30]|nr:hypothetical protein BGX28_009198 [Mortierella sp. GBA30]
MFANCAQACREMYALFTPYIWRTIEIKSTSQATRFMNQEATLALRRNRHLIQTFSTRLPPVLQTFIRAFDTSGRNARSASTNLQSLSLKWPSVFRFQWDAAVTSLVAKSPHLRDLDIDLSDPNRVDFGKGLKGSHDLRQLRINSPDIKPERLVMILDAIPEQVERLTLDVVVPRQKNDRSMSPPPTIERQPHGTALKKLSLHGSILASPENVRIRIHDRCKGLEELTMTGKLSDVDMQSTSRLFLSSSPDLAHLRFLTTDAELEDASIAAFISRQVTKKTLVSSSYPYVAPQSASTASSTATSQSFNHRQPSKHVRFQWKSIEINAPGFGARSSSAIARHAKTLQDVVLPEGGLQDRHLQDLLTKSPRLERLISLGVKNGPELMNKTLLRPAKLVNGVSWRCLNTLKELQISLSPGIVQPQERNALLNQLAGLKQLRVLHLHNGDGSMRRAGFTDFSIKNGGLKRLQGLQKLEAFEIKDFEHRIGKKETVWMGMKLQSLERICLDCEYDHHAKRRRKMERKS